MSSSRSLKQIYKTDISDAKTTGFVSRNAEIFSTILPPTRIRAEESEVFHTGFEASLTNRLDAVELTQVKY
ncbi:MAG: hypothetical protein OHK0029_00420 [Armatimonadaceae bacterium]